MRAVAANTAAPSKALLILAFAAIYVLWGSTYLAIRYTVETMPPFLMAGVRALVAGVILFAAVGVPRLRDLTWVHWRTAILSGGLFFLGCHGLLYRMERTTDSGVAALMLATIPGWMAILSCLTGRSSLTARTLAGLLLGLVGVALLVLRTEPIARPACSPISASVLLVSALSWACGSLYGRSAPLPEHAGTATAMQLLGGGALTMLVGLLIGEGSHVDLAHVSLRSAFSLLYMIVFGSLVCFSAYTWLLRVAELTTVGTYAYVNPIVALFLGWLLGGEFLGAQSITAAAVIVLGVVLIHHDQSRPGRQRTSTRDEGQRNKAVASRRVAQTVGHGDGTAICTRATSEKTLAVTQNNSAPSPERTMTSPCISCGPSSRDTHQEVDSCWVMH